MKLISLNIWAGTVYKPLIEFLEQCATNTDIFCLQEVWHNPNPTEENMAGAVPGTRPEVFLEISDALNNHNGYFAPSIEGIEGNAIFLKKESIAIERDFNIPIFEPKDATINGVPAYRRTLQGALLKVGDKEFLIANVHGLWNGGPKTDTPERIEQSKLIKDFLDSNNFPKILCGDFNLLPETESIKILEDNMENLIKTNNVQSTRSKFYDKPTLFADYIFVSPDVAVKNFEVPNIEVSDHLPMVLDFEI